MIFLLICCTLSEKDTSTHQESTIFVSGRVVELFGAVGMEDIDVCLVDTSLCTKTDAEGFYTVEAATQSNHILHLSSSEHVGGALAFTTQDADLELANVSLLTPALTEGQFTALDQQWESDTGVLAFSISNGINGDGINVPNVEIQLTPQAGNGPFYSNALGIPVDNLNATSDNGGGVVINLPEGTYHVNYSGIPNTCELLLGWDSVESHHIPIVSDRVSFARISCPE